MTRGAGTGRVGSRAGRPQPGSGPAVWAARSRSLQLASLPPPGPQAWNPAPVLGGTEETRRAGLRASVASCPDPPHLPRDESHLVEVLLLEGDRGCGRPCRLFSASARRRSRGEQGVCVAVSINCQYFLLPGRLGFSCWRRHADSSSPLQRGQFHWEH